MRCKPGVRFCAISAASMAKVPEPHIGFTKGDFLSHCVAMMVEVANASNIGALPGCLRYPCLDNVSPEVSRKISALSSTQCRWITALERSAPELGRFPFLSFILSTMASFTLTLAYSGVVMVSLFTKDVTEK